jgi:exopolysaccharide biosynthesis polyprenyl glycosylphosphotransferase
MKRSELFLMILQVPIDYIMLFLAGASAFGLRFTSWAVALKPVMFNMTFLDFAYVLCLTATVWIIIFSLLGLYKPDPNKKLLHDITNIVLGCSAGLALVAVYVMFTQQLFDSRFLVVVSWVLSIIYVIVGRLFVRGIKSIMYRMGIGLRQIVIIGNDEMAISISEVLKSRKELGYNVVKIFKNFDSELEKLINSKKIDEVIFTNPRAREKEALSVIEICNNNHIIFKYSADLFSTYSGNMTIHPLAGVPIVELRRTSLGAWGRVVKRLFDVILSIILIALLSPIMLICFLIILLETGRPVIYKNERVGIRGKRFFTLKFRSMYQKDSTGSQFGRQGKKAEEKEKELIEKQSARTGPIYKIADDPRVTGFGRFMRRWSIDELPQFFNVLFGSMSIVGPRPHQPREVQHYENEYKQVFTLKPGVTGLAQISGRSDLSFEDEMKLDIFYTEHWKLLTDIVIFIKTPFILFKKRKAL